MVTLTMTRREIEDKLGGLFAPKQTTSLVDLFDTLWLAELERAVDTRDLKRGLTELTGEVRKLTIAQQRTDERIDKLTAAQQRTDETVERLGRSVETLAQTTQEGMSKLWEAVGGLATGMDGLREDVDGLATREDVDSLAKGMDGLREDVDGLTEGMDGLREDVDGLTEGMDGLRAEVGGLANRFGFSLEEFVAALLPPYLEWRYGIADLTLERGYFDLTDGQAEEVDLVGTGRRDDRPVTVLAECRTTIGGGGTRQLAEKLNRVAATAMAGEVVKVIVAMNVHPTATKAAQETGVWMIPYSRINRSGEFKN